MNSVIEIHDSILGSVSWRGTNLVVSLRPAYVHCSTGQPAVDSGTVWVMNLDLVISEASVQSLPLTVPIDLSEGYFAIGDTRWENTIPFPSPIDPAHHVRFLAWTGIGESIAAGGTKASIETSSKLQYVEDFLGLS